MDYLDAALAETQAALTTLEEVIDHADTTSLDQLANVVAVLALNVRAQARLLQLLPTLD